LSRFTKPLIVEYIDGKDWKLHEAFNFYLEGNPHEIITVPRGYVTDFASVPNVLRMFAKDIELFNKAAILHDFLYDGETRFTRKESDQIYRDGMRVFGVSDFRSTIFYKMCRLFGKSRWGGQ